MTAFRESLRRRFLVSFAGLLAGLAVLSLLITLGSLFFYYRSTVDGRIREVSRRFEQALQEAEEALLFRTRILADVARIEAMGLDARLVREIQVYTLRWLKRDGLQVVGMGGAEYWQEQGLPLDSLRRAFAGIPTLELSATGDGPPKLLAATPREGPDGVSEVIVASLPLDLETLRGLALRSGGELVLHGEDGRLLSSSLSRASVLGGPVVPAYSRGEVGAVTLDGRSYAYRTFPLRISQRRYGQYAVLWPAEELRVLTLRLALWQLGGLALVLVLFYFLYRQIIAGTTSDIESLTNWARAFSPTDPSPPPSLARADEVGVLSSTFAELVDDLEGALREVRVKNEALAQVNVSLEDKVREKTREVEEQRRMLDTVLSGMRQAVFLLEPDDTVSYANPAARDTFGDVVGRACQTLWGSEPCPCAEKVASEHQIARDGRTYLVSYAPLGRTGRAVLVAQDITQRRALERQLQQAQKLESVGRLAGGVAHDFNNVLGSIVPSVDLLRRRITDPKAQACLDTIEIAADRASAVVRQLLTFSRSGEFRPVPIDLNAAVEGAINLLRPGLKGVEIDWRPGNGLPVVRADETQIQQVVLNLALNAVDAMGGQGSIRLETGSVEGEERVLLAAEDTGPGIPTDLADKVFDPFFTTKEPGKGTGLGLSIVYGVVERHGGEIRVTSSPSGGARFEIELPAVGGRRTADPQPLEPAGTLLVVDDDELLLGSLAESLRDLGFEVLAASRGAEALETVRSKALPLDAAVLDVRMPEMDGVELAERLRELHADLPVLFMTGYAADHGKDISRVSPHPPLLKPFPPSRLVEILRTVLRNKKKNAV